ncbi:hypothetical protein ABZ845_30775 [Streptomyces sp. NPDC047022]|uniref:hypothetical protein n=1 Tax=Streptomyces sp. NPDC047022 TaxID=3155737 RepID=UPI0033CCD390
MADKGLFRRISDRLFPSRKTPVRATTQAKQVRDREYGGSTKRMAEAYGRDPRTVQRWINGDRTPQGKDAEKLEQAAAAVQVTERGRERRAKQIAARATPVKVRVDRVSGQFKIKGSDAFRDRPLDIELDPEQAERLVMAETDDETREVLQEAIAEEFGARWNPDDFEFDASGIDVV